jgi:uncharacterized delta-60 repeat protein
MLSRFPSLDSTGDLEPRRRSVARLRSPLSRRTRTFRGRVEPLEGRALLTFGSGGIVTGPVGQAFSLAVQPADQKIVAGGDAVTSKGMQAFDLVRYNTDGSLDLTFGSGGVVTTTFGNYNYPAVNSILVQPDGKIVAGGSDVSTKTYPYSGQFALARYTSTGSPDTTFGNRGVVTTSFPSSDGQAGINTVLLRSDGEIVAVGSVQASTSNNMASVALALYKSSGALDSSFGSSGTVVDAPLSTSASTPNPGGGTTTVYKYFEANGGALERDNSILVAGTYVTETKVTTSSGSYSWTVNERDLALVHYLAGGKRDLSFGTSGVAILPVTSTGLTTSDATGNNIVVQPDGAIVEVGTARSPDDAYNDIVLARYNANGTPDATFGGGAGYTLVDMGTLGTYPSGDLVWSFGDSVALQPNGQILAAGTVATSFNSTNRRPTAYAFATVRLNPDGSIDSGFGRNGAAITQVLYNEYDPVAVGLETIGNQTMVVDATRAMVSSTNNTQDFALVRYTPSGSLDSGTTSAMTAAVSSRTSGAAPSHAGPVPGGPLADTPIGRMTIGLTGSMPTAPSIIPVAGLVPQSLDSSDLIDRLPSGRRRR